jgi:hypothetical protein
LDDENDNNKLIRNVRNIYLWRVYLKKFENFEQFQNFKYKSYKFPIFKELLNKIKEEKSDKNNQYIFTESFISKNNFNEFKKLQIELSMNDKLFLFDFNEINSNFDIFYCSLVNKGLSYLYHSDKQRYINKLKNIYNITKDELNLKNEGNLLYQYLMNYERFENDIVKKISENPLKQEEFEILLYSFRFVFNILSKNGNNFYKSLLKKNASQFIKDNYIPGSFPFIN